MGPEIVATAAGEAKNPRMPCHFVHCSVPLMTSAGKSLPRAVRLVALRIIVFYVVGAFVIGELSILFSIGSDSWWSNSLRTNRSVERPWLERHGDERDSSVLAICHRVSSAFAKSLILRRIADRWCLMIDSIRNAGIKGLPSVINAAILSSAWSASSSDLFASSRALRTSPCFHYRFLLTVYRCVGTCGQRTTHLLSYNELGHTMGSDPLQLTLRVPGLHEP